MEKMIAYCGIECTKCPAYIAKQENNNELRKKFAEEQSKLYNITIPSESINCDGCRSVGEHLGYCSICKIRECCMEKKLENCAFCDDYICEKLERVYMYMADVLGKVVNNEPEAKITLDEIRKKV